MGVEEVEILCLVQKSFQKFCCHDKSKGDKGSPCLTPLVQWQVFPGTPLSRTNEVRELKMLFFQLNQVSLEPFCCIICNIA
jgi:hypothetical protein